MAEHVYGGVEPYGPIVRRRISWGSVFAGVVVAISIQMLLALLGLSIGLSTINPTSEAEPLAGLGWGSVIWWIAASLIALFCGGWVAGRLAGVPRAVEGLLHGVLAWGAMTVISLVVVTSAAGNLLSLAGNAAGQMLSYVGQSAANLTSAVDGQAIQQSWSGDAGQQVRREARDTLRQTGKAELQPKQLQESGSLVADEVRESAATAATQPARLDEEFESVLNTFMTQVRTKGQAVDREAVVNVLVARTDMSREEAQRVVRRWEDQLAAWNNEVKSTLSDAGQKAAEVGEQTADTLGSAALWAFVALLVGAGASAVGGWLGTPSPVVLDSDSLPRTRRVD